MYAPYTYNTYKAMPHVSRTLDLIMEWRGSIKMLSVYVRHARIIIIFAYRSWEFCPLDILHSMNINTQKIIFDLRKQMQNVF